MTEQIPLKPRWWQFWKWHFCRCTTQSHNDGVWGECVICHNRYGYVDRQTLRAYCDREIEREMARRKGEDHAK